MSFRYDRIQRRATARMGHASRAVLAGGAPLPPSFGDLLVWVDGTDLDLQNNSTLTPGTSPAGISNKGTLGATLDLAFHSDVSNPTLEIQEGIAHIYQPVNDSAGSGGYWNFQASPIIGAATPFTWAVLARLDILPQAGNRMMSIGFNVSSTGPWWSMGSEVAFPLTVNAVSWGLGSGLLSLEDVLQYEWRMWVGRNNRAGTADLTMDTGYIDTATIITELSVHGLMFPGQAIGATTNPANLCRNGCNQRTAQILLYDALVDPAAIIAWGNAKIGQTMPYMGTP